MKLVFTFDRARFYTVDVSNETTENINRCVWILLHTLKAKSVILDIGDEK